MNQSGGGSISSDFPSYLSCVRELFAFMDCRANTSDKSKGPGLPTGTGGRKARDLYQEPRFSHMTQKGLT